MPVVLVVEDSEECAATLEIAINTIPGVEVIMVRTAEEAIRMADRKAVDAVVTDFHLPGMDGIELVAHLRRNVGCKSIPILVISGDSDRRTPQRALDAGATAYIAKPYSPSAVRQQLENLIHVA